MMRAALSLWVALCAHAAVTFEQKPGLVHVWVDGLAFTTLHYGPDVEKPYLHPLRSASGLVVTRGYPVTPVPGETTDHPHHRGMWYGHGDINGVDFWTSRGEKMGRLRARGNPEVSASGTLRLQLDMVAPGGQVIGTMTQEFTFSGPRGLRIVDIHLTIDADRGVDLKLGDTKEGAMAVRVADSLREPAGATLLNSSGLTGEAAIWGKRARWVDYSGKVGGTAVGIAMFDHPSNPNHPTFWMARGYGLNAANAFGSRAYGGPQAPDGAMTIVKGGRLAFRWRVVIHPGDAKAVGIEALYKAFAR